ncbi:hypothetical protein FQR65_LT10479 [Abscondita terminalis]|nr:hypothetical protein FQR65_LT10479 [Abscondita terminalis]
MIRKNSLSSCSASDGNDNDSVITTSEVDCEVMLGEDFTDDNPTFGNIQVKNSTDIHFGNKTYCQGPVTIKQIVYASPEAHNGAENKNNSIVFDVSNLSKDNLGFVPDNNVSKIKSDSNKNNEEFIERAPTIKGTQWFRNFSPQQTVLIAALVVILLVSLIASTSILLTRDQSEDRGITKYPDDSDEQEQGTPVKYPVDSNVTIVPEDNIITRKLWSAKLPKQSPTLLDLPVPYVIIMHTATEFCTDIKSCMFHVKTIQDFHVGSRGWDDIGYNFLVGGDGHAYEGRGWKSVGAQVFGYNTKCIGIAFIGTFTQNLPPQRQIDAAKKLIQRGLNDGIIALNYKLLAARQLQTTQSPGEAFKINIFFIDPTVNLTLPDKLKIISRKEWLAQPAFKQINELVLPIPYVVISHTATENCTDQAACTFYIRFLQTYHIESRNYSDIVYNFLVGGDGYAYEGRGWKYEGAHTYGFNSKSLGIAFVGTFNNIMPPDRQILAAKQLIEKGVGLGFVAKNYRLFGERQLQDTKSPGNMLFEDIKTWPHWFKLSETHAIMNAFTIILFLVSPLLKVDCWKIFHKGRAVGGNLGLPGRDNQFHSTQDIPDQWFDQKLDHFNPTDSRKWKQLFFSNEQFHDVSVGGPVFLMIGGEGAASPRWMTSGAWIEYAKKFGALCFQLEHRYYGKSHPTMDMSTKHLKYLSSQQALADLGEFIIAMNERYKLPSTIKWIVFGGSYPGSLAAWMRLKYPHLVHGAMSASGPLLAEVDFQDYFKVVDESLNTYSEDCVNEVKKGTSQIDTFLSHIIGQRNIDKKFRLCDPIEESVNNPKDISNFYETIAGNFAFIVQYNKDFRMGGTQKISNITIDTLCDIMTSKDKGSPIDRLAAVNSLLLDATNMKCLSYKYDEMIKELRDISWGSAMAEGGRQWTYQTCTEFGFFQSSSYNPQVFGNKFPVDFFIEMCTDIFGPKFNSTFLDAGVDRTNTFYGALDIEVSNVVFVHGSIDPWHALGITKTVAQDAPAIYIEGTAHCANMYPSRDSDLPQLKAAREQIVQLIDKWIRL